jgi:HEAT repeat protein
MTTSADSDLGSLEVSLRASLDALRHGDAADREQAAEFWNALAEALPTAVDLLAATLRGATPAVRGKAVRALGNLGRQAREIQSPIRNAVKRVSLWDEDGAVRSQAAEGLAQVGGTARTPVTDLIQALHDPNAPIRFSAAQALGERGADSLAAVGVLLQKALSDPDGGVRLEAAMALYKIDRREEKILPILIKALRDPDEVRRWIAADCLGEIGPAAREAVPVLRELLQSEFKSPLIRASVALALEKIEGARA